MRYVTFVCVDAEGERYAPEEENTGEWVEELDPRKVPVLANRLKGVDRPMTLRRKGKMLVTDGPFAETREWIGGC